MAVVDTRIPLSRKSLDTASPLFRLSQQQRQRELDEERRNNRAEDVEFRNKRAEVDDTFRQQGMDLRREEFESNKGFRNRSLGIQERNASLNRELKNLQIANEKINNLNAREQSRMNSVIQGGAELGIFLENGDMAGAEQYLLKRKASIGRMISEGQDIDTTDTDAALLAIRSGDEAQIQKLKQTTNNLRDIGVIRGLIKAEEGGGIGGATGELANRLIEEGSANTVADALLLIKGGFNKGLTIGDDGNLITREGLTDSLAQIKGAEQFGKDTGKANAEAQNSLNDQSATLPRLENVVDRLSDLGQKATFTKAGQVVDTTRRELGLPVGEGAVSRSEYIATVDNEILPLLRQTFGAAFTQKEGESLKATLGNPDVSPEEKDAVLRAFIDQKRSQIQTLQRITNQSETSNEVIDYTEFFQ